MSDPTVRVTLLFTEVADDVRLADTPVRETMKGLLDPHGARSQRATQAAHRAYRALGHDNFIIRVRGDVVTIEVLFDEHLTTQETP